MNFEIHFLIGFISEMDNNSSREKVSFNYFSSVNVKGNWAYLADKNSWPVAKITTAFRLSWKCLNLIIIKTF